MTAWINITLRELRERRLAPALGIGVGMIAWLAPTAAPVAGLGGGERMAVALTLAASYAVLLALIVGPSFCAGDLAGGRLGFYFSKPIGGVSIWCGKFLAAALLVLGSGALVLLPTLIFGEAEELAAVASVGRMTWVPVLLLGLLLVGHAISVIARARTPWMIVDLVATGVAAVAAWTAWSLLQAEGASLAALLGLAVGAALALLGIWCSGLRQVVVGRSDLAAGHRALSQGLAVTLIGVSLVVVGWSRWIVAGEIDDLAGVERVVAAPQGSWVAVAGSLGRYDYMPVFALDTSSGRSVKLGGRDFLVGFSDGGDELFWLRPETGSALFPATLFRADLTTDQPQPRGTAVRFDSAVWSLRISPDNSVVAAVLAQGRLVAYELVTGRPLASRRLDGMALFSSVIRFASASRVRVISEFPLQLADVELVSNELVGPRSPATTETCRLKGLDRAGERLVCDQWLIDGDSGDVMTDLGGGRFNNWVHFLDDSQVLQRLHSGSERTVRLFTSDGKPVWTRSLAVDSFMSYLGQNENGDVLITVSRPYPDRKEFEVETYELDLFSGRVNTLDLSGLTPVGSTSSQPGRGRVDILFDSDHGALFTRDSSTGTLREILRGRPETIGRWSGYGPRWSGPYEEGWSNRLWF